MECGQASRAGCELLMDMVLTISVALVLVYFGMIILIARIDDCSGQDHWGLRTLEWAKFVHKGTGRGVWTKCQPDKMPTGQNANLGWHFVRDFFSMVGILSGPTFWLAFCLDHLNMS